jgi:hypothetical protein
VATIFRGISREATPLLHVSTIFRGISREATPLLHVSTIFTAFPVWQRRLQVFSFFFSTAADPVLHKPFHRFGRLH